MPPPRSVTFMLGDENVSNEVYASFRDEPYVAVLQSAAVRATVTAPADKLDKAAVEEMLADKSDWTLAVPKGSKTGVLERKLLQAIWDELEGDVTLNLRSPTPGETIVLNDSAALYGPSASWGRVKDAVGYPVAQAGLVATGAGLFGLLALQSDITHLWAMKAAIVTAFAATGFSVFYGARLKTIEVRPARLDLVRTLQTSMYAHALRRARFGIGLLLVAVVFAIIATWPSGEGTQSASIGKPTISTPAGGTKHVTLTIAWTHLGANVAKLRSTISGSPGSTVTPVASAKTAEQHLQTEIAPSVSSVRVETSALDAHDRQVGTGYTKVVTLPTGS